MTITGPAQATASHARGWAQRKGATEEFIGLAPIYWRFASAVGVRPEVAYVQAGKETGYGKFGGVITAKFFNPCGLKTRKGGGNEDPGAHQRFPTWEVGIQAHIDHLALYAGAFGYPRPGTFDPRHFETLLGKAKIVEDLGGTWAPSLSYGKEIVREVRHLINED